MLRCSRIGNCFSSSRNRTIRIRSAGRRRNLRISNLGRWRPGIRSRACLSRDRIRYWDLETTLPTWNSPELSMTKKE